MRGICALISVAMLCGGCAAPNTPGAGAGANYTPVIDLQGVIPDRYAADLNGCRSYAQTINPAGEAIAGALVGALVGAAIGAAVGGGTRWQGSLTRYGAGYGATSGALQGGGHGVLTQQRIMTNCMAGRGYRTLDGSMPVAYYGPSPYAAMGAAAVEQAQVMPVAYEPAYSHLPAPVAPRATGKDTYQAETVAKAQSCAAQPVATLSARGGGFETYAVPCSNGDTLAIRCEFGNCRVLQ